MKYKITTLGCKVNQYETAAMEGMLAAMGHGAAETVEGADVLIVNTCTVTGESSRKSRQAIRRLRDKNPSALLAVCGCFSQISPDEVAALGADLVYGSGERREFVSELERLYNMRTVERGCGSTVETVDTATAGAGGTGVRTDGTASVVRTDDPRKRRVFEMLPYGTAAGRTRAMLKIEDGCDNYCSYCIIPHARGRVRSLPVAEAVSRARVLRDEGYRELVVTGIEISSYGKDISTDLPSLLTELSAAVPGMRLRLGSLEPSSITRAFVETLAGLDSICDHFHLSLQSGCDTVLRRMRRKYDTAGFESALCCLREFFSNCGVTADLITGFPGETESEHLETLAFIEHCGFSSMHIFPYSQRPGTPAAAMDGQLARTEKSRRAKQAQSVADAMERDYLKSCVGRELEVLFETEKDGLSTGHASNYTQVTVEAVGLRGCVKNAVILDFNRKTLVGLVK